MQNYTEYNYTPSDLEKLKSRPERSNKYTFGKVLFVCGSNGMAGAAYLSALAAYRSGAGLCEIYTPEQNRVILQTLLPEAIIKTYNTDAPYLSEFRGLLKKCDSAVIGCGLGKSDASLSILKTLLTEYKRPCVIDADALNLISEHPELKKLLKGNVITPHLAEMSRLCGKQVSEIAACVPSVCAEFAKQYGTVCVLKDHRTAVSDGGERIYINTSGNSAMAKAGSGDVLAGVIGALLARRDAPLTATDAATLGVYIHGLAGDIAADKLGSFSPLASDIANSISAVLRDI